MVVAWQTDEIKPGNSAFTVDYGTTTSYGKSVNPTGRIVNNYLSADPALPVPPTAPGARTDYFALLSGLDYDTTYFYRFLPPFRPRHAFRRLPCFIPYPPDKWAIFIPGPRSSRLFFS